MQNSVCSEINNRPDARRLELADIFAPLRRRKLKGVSVSLGLHCARNENEEANRKRMDCVCVSSAELN